MARIVYQTVIPAATLQAVTVNHYVALAQYAPDTPHLPFQGTFDLGATSPATAIIAKPPPTGTAAPYTMNGLFVGRTNPYSVMNIGVSSGVQTGLVGGQLFVFYVYPDFVAPTNAGESSYDNVGIPITATANNTFTEFSDIGAQSLLAAAPSATAILSVPPHYILCFFCTTAATGATPLTITVWEKGIGVNAAS